jgi:hypothetical protein
LLLVLTMAATASARAQDIGPVSFRDSLVMRQVAFRAPCPTPVPKSWTIVDSTLGSGGNRRAIGTRCDDAVVSG